MTDYVCQVARNDGTKVTLHRSAHTEKVLMRDLNAEGYFILSIGAAAAKSRSERKLSAKAVIQFTEMLATLMANGLALKDALVLARTLAGKPLEVFLSELDASVQKGTSLHDSLAAGWRGFSPLYRGLVRIGEQTGDLTAILPRLAAYLKARQATKEKTINAMVYPLFVLVVAFLGIVLLSVFVLPILTETIGGLNPEVARQYNANVTAFQTAAGLIALALALSTGAFLVLRRVALHVEALALALDRFYLRLPLVGPLLWQSFCLHVSFSMEILLASGYSLESAMDESTAVVTNKALNALWTRSREQVLKGTPLSAALQQERGFPDSFVGWVRVGEAGHDLLASFRQLRSFYQERLDTLAVRFTNLAEPALIVVVGGMVIALVLTFITPIFTMMGRVF